MDNIIKRLNEINELIGYFLLYCVKFEDLNCL